MKAYVAIGHWRGNQIITRLTDFNTRKGFLEDCRGNGFIAQAVFSRERIEEIYGFDEYDLFEVVAKQVTSTPACWDIVDYLLTYIDVILSELELMPN